MHAYRGWKKLKEGYLKFDAYHYLNLLTYLNDAFMGFHGYVGPHSMKFDSPMWSHHYVICGSHTLCG